MGISRRLAEPRDEVQNSSSRRWRSPAEAVARIYAVPFKAKVHWRNLPGNRPREQALLRLAYVATFRSLKGYHRYATYLLP